MNSSEIFNHGYVAGYNQARVDRGLMTQDEADEILRTGFGNEVNIPDKYKQIDIDIKRRLVFLSKKPKKTPSKRVAKF